MTWFEEKDGCIFLNVRVVPRAAKNVIAGLMDDGALKIRIQAPPVEGRANACLVKFLSGLWDIPRADIGILSGATGRNKRIRISNPTDEIRNELLSLGND